MKSAACTAAAIWLLASCGSLHGSGEQPAIAGYSCPSSCVPPACMFGYCASPVAIPSNLVVN
jgi:hypothetical protein